MVALAIRLEDRGAIFYRQKRVGKDGRVFECLKFRSMKVDSNEVQNPLPTLADDPRVTRVGRLLRATAMDELPQLWNILRGEMSFVGPRPEWEELVRQFRRQVVGFDRRHVLRPGLTGVAQIYGHAEMSRWKKLRYDLFYIRKRSFSLDLQLIFTSFLITFLGRWELRRPKLAWKRRQARLRRPGSSLWERSEEASRGLMN
jgi:lipopolysaccharide/colanic/teichoic acid biosynthesis glycosyltransferase